MKTFLVGASFAALMGASTAVLAQSDQTTTTVTRTPDSTTETTVTKTQDADGDYTQYRKTVTSTHQYNAGAWTAPAGFTYHKFALGDRLPSDLLADSYYLGNYSVYGLTAPPEGTVWVRVGSDAFLVRNDTGEVIQADYGMFD